MWTMNFQMFKLVLEKAEEPRDQIANIHWIIKKAREFQKNIYFCFIDYIKAFDCEDHNKLWKIRREMGIPDHRTASWEICMQVKKQQLELDMEQQTGSISGKEYIKTVYCTLLFNLYAEYIMQNIGLDEAHAGIKITGKNINNLSTHMTLPYGRKQTEIEKSLDESERGEWKSWPKVQHS